MKNQYLIVLALLFPCFLNAQVTFQKVYTNSLHQSSKEVVATGDGGYLIAGMTRTQFAGDSDLYVIKTNGLGEIQWTKTYGGTHPEYPNCILTLEDGNFFIIGYTSSYGAGSNDAWLIKINPSGDLLWSRTYGGVGDDEAKEIIRTSDGNYAFVGRTNYSGGTNFDGFLYKIDGSGNVIWNKNYGGALYENLRCVKLCADGGFILTGQTMSSGAGGSDIYLVRTNSNGDVMWTQTYGGALEDDGNFIVVNNDGSFTITAETTSFGAGDFDVQAMKVDANGGVIWNKFYGGDKKDVSKTIRPTNDGGYIIGAISRSFGWINPDMWLVKIDGNGEKLWDKHYGLWYHDHCHSALPTSDGGYALVGHQVDAGNLAHVFFVKTNSNGTVDAVGIDEDAAEEAQDEAEISSLKIYPNPSSGIFYVQLPTDEIRTIHIGDALGNIVKVIRSEHNFVKVDLSEQPQGIYFATIKTPGKSTVTKKIIVR
jgi:hypothetical protein